MSAPLTEPEGPELKRSLSVNQLFATAFGSIVGVAWVIVLGDMIRLGGPGGAVIGLTFGAIVVLAVALCYAELAALIPVAGGEVAYLDYIFGPRAGFLVGWVLALCYVTTGAFEALSLGWIVTVLAPSLEGPMIYQWMGVEVKLGGLAIALGATLLITVVNVQGVAVAGRLQQWTTYSKTVLGLSAIAAAMLLGSASNLQPLFVSTSQQTYLDGILAVFLTAAFWFAGFNFIAPIIEERSRGAKLSSLGLAFGGAILASLLFYALLVIGCSMLLPWQELVRLELPAAAAFAAVGRPELRNAILMVGLLGVLTTWNGMVLSSSRILFAFGRAGVLPKSFAQVRRGSGTPVVAIVLIGLLTAAGVMMGRAAILPFVNLVSICLAATYVCVCAGVIAMRRRAPHLPRPYSVPGGAVTAGLGLIGSLLMLGVALYGPMRAQGLPLEWLLLVGWLVVGGAIWTTSRTRRRLAAHPTAPRDAKDVE